MTTLVTKHERQLIQDLYQQSSENLYLNAALSAFGQGRTADALSTMLSAFGRFDTGFLPRKGRIYFSGKGLEHVLIQVHPDKPIAVVVRRRTVARFDVQHKPRDREALILWLRKYSVRHQRAAVKDQPSSDLRSTRTTAAQQPQLPFAEVEDLRPRSEPNMLMAPLARLHC